MNNVLEIEGLVKAYPRFRLDEVSFSVPEGCIMGFIGRNGAGKTTTIKSALGLVHPDAGSVRFFGMDMQEHEAQIKQHIGYASGDIGYYPRKKIADIVSITRRFFQEWDEDRFQEYLDIFSLDVEKTPSELSQGMKVKMNLALALSHNARFLLLDEPTSGLDPVSRDELLTIFGYLRDRGATILFSTHITSDLDRCADWITYIREGHLVASQEKASFIAACSKQGLGSNLEEIMIAYEREALDEKLAR